MTAYNVPANQRNRRIALAHAAAISVAFVSGTFALIALLLGSPFEYGSALALCGAAWIVAHIAERFAEQEHARRMRSRQSRRRTTGFAPGYIRLGAPVERYDRSTTRSQALHHEYSRPQTMMVG